MDEEEARQDRNKILFVIAALFAHARLSVGHITTPGLSGVGGPAPMPVQSAFNDADEFLKEAERRGINIAETL